MIKQTPKNPLQRYKGDGSPPDPAVTDRYPYRASAELARAVNISIALRRPLLVNGEPGCGKTRLAGSVAYELGLPLYEWHIKSTSRARDGLYTIDMVRRLQDGHLRDKKAQKLAPYIRFGPLGEALRSHKESVVLIDEVDKADIDFPNDLLRELEEKKFTIEELDPAEASRRTIRKTYDTKCPPIVIITSNDEKELPDAFLRRCIYAYIPFPKHAELIDIVCVNMPSAGLDRDLVTRAATHLLKIQENPGQWRKAPATSELIDWVRILHERGVKVAELDTSRKLSELPDWRVLFKHLKDVRVAEKLK